MGQEHAYYVGENSQDMRPMLLLQLLLLIMFSRCQHQLIHLLQYIQTDLRNEIPSGIPPGNAAYAGKMTSFGQVMSDRSDYSDFGESFLASDVLKRTKQVSCPLIIQKFCISTHRLHLHIIIQDPSSLLCNTYQGMSSYANIWVWR